jgi:hypothetical protein
MGAQRWHFDRWVDNRCFRYTGERKSLSRTAIHCGFPNNFQLSK